LTFLDSADTTITVHAYTSDLTYFATRHTKTVTLSAERPASFGIEFTQNLNQENHHADCVAPRARAVVPESTGIGRLSFRLSWPAGKKSWNYAINWCFAGWRYGETPLESGSTPAVR
jgi:hypothetical protein